MQSRNIPQEENKQIAFFKKSFLQLALNVKENIPADIDK